MKSYKYVVVYSGEDRVFLDSTDSQVLNWIFAEVQKFFHSSRRMKSKDKLPSGEIFHITIDKLKGEGIAVHWWIVRELCLRGWEPFSGHGGSHLRFEVADTRADE